ncbi:Sec-independent protein translocase protein TatB [Paeniroseomonas aquatica]|uniref:Sec-independent protein translocase protein TatB n=1 Tax=Paeniroseomonas aquatica TaxID=373043 RepID=UPI0036095681
MFDLAWSEIALVGVVALVVIGPKDLPEAIRGVARGIAKLRRMASEFQGQADELVREANLDEVRNSINEIRNFNVRDQFTKAVDKDGSIRKTFTEDPLKPDYTPIPRRRRPRPPASRWGRASSRRRLPWKGPAPDPAAPARKASPRRRRRPSSRPPSCRRRPWPPRRPPPLPSCRPPDRRRWRRPRRRRPPRPRAEHPNQCRAIRTISSTTSRCRCSTT